MSVGERRLHEGRGAEEDQADAIAHPPIEELIEHLLHGGQAIDGLARVVGEIFVLHGAGKIHGEEQVAARYDLDDRVLEPLRPAEGDGHSDPAKDQHGLLQSTPSPHGPTAARLLSEDLGDPAEKGHQDGVTPFAMFGEDARKHEWQHADKQEPGMGETDHCPSLWCRVMNVRAAARICSSSAASAKAAPPGS